MAGPLEFELGKTAYVIVKELFRLQAGESLLITVDSAGEWRPAEEVAKAAEAVGAKVMVAWHSTPPGYGKVGDPGLPDPLKAAIPNTDAWLELNNQWLLYSTPWETAMKKGSRVRYLFMGGLNVDQMVRCVGKINWAAQEAFQQEHVSSQEQELHLAPVRVRDLVAFLQEVAEPESDLSIVPTDFGQKGNQKIVLHFVPVFPSWMSLNSFRNRGAR